MNNNNKEEYNKELVSGLFLVFAHIHMLWFLLSMLLTAIVFTKFKLNVEFALVPTGIGTIILIGIFVHIYFKERVTDEN